MSDLAIRLSAIHQQLAFAVADAGDVARLAEPGSADRERLTEAVRSLAEAARLVRLARAALEVPHG